MSTHSPDHDAREEVADDDQYAEITVGHDELVIYDRENHRAWLQSSVAVAVEERR